MSPNATALVVSGDLERLSRWATWLEEEGFDTVGCPGPEIRNRCPRADGLLCPLREVVDVAVVDAPSLDPHAPERLCMKLDDDHRTIFLGPEGMEVTFANGAGHLRTSDPVDRDTLISVVRHVSGRTGPAR
jgi:hypothetical protein